MTYTLIQLFKHIISRHFHSILQAMNSLHISQFALLPLASFLFLLEEAPTTLIVSGNLQISLSDGYRYDKLQRKVQNIVLTLKNVNSKAAKEVVVDEGD
jgi:hypothetical protein